MAICKFCKKELWNRNIVEIDIHKEVIWSDDKEIIVESKGGGRYYCHLSCFYKKKKELKNFKRGKKNEN